ncbi:MAG: methyltransferase domain-containing protein, partial [Flavobacterium sp.]
MSIDTTYRIDAVEMMDDFSLEGELLTDALDKIAGINRFLGGNKVTLQGVQHLLADIPKDYEITIVDLGCGNGDMLRALADFAVKDERHFKLIGIDANRCTIDYAKSLSTVYPAIDYKCADIFNLDLSALQCDIALATLTLHHFVDEDILHLLKDLNKNSRIGIVVNDLERSGLAYHLFKMICFLFNLNRMSREDGLVSILRGFKKKELVAFSEKLGLKKYSIRWKWA